jgi:hypothetical protein
MILFPLMTICQRLSTKPQLPSVLSPHGSMCCSDEAINRSDGRGLVAPAIEIHIGPTPSIAQIRRGRTKPWTKSAYVGGPRLIWW